MNIKSVIKTLLPSTTAVFGLLVMMSVSIYAQTVLVNYDFASTTAGTPCVYGGPLTTASGVTSSFITSTGNCTTPIGTAATAPPAFVANAANQAVSIAGFNTGTSGYFQFQLSGVSAYQDYMLFFQAQRSGTGPVNADIQYSTDGTNFTTFQTVNPGNGVFAAFNIDLSAIAAIENQPTVYFRILGYGGTSINNSGTFRIDNFQVRAVASPTAASVSVSGRVLGANTRPVYRALVYLTDQNGETRTAVTNAFGYYRFQDVSVGQTYMINVLSKRYLFQPQVLTINEETDNLNFLAAP